MANSIWDKENDEGRRQYVYSVLQVAKGWAHLFNLARCISDIAHEPCNVEKKNFHNSRYRRKLTEDFDAINRDPRYSKIIIHGDKGAKLATREEAAYAIEAERREAIKKLAKCARIAYKANLNTQFRFPEQTEIEAFMVS